MANVLSLKNMAAIRVAINILHHRDLKEEIFNFPELEFTSDGNGNFFSWKPDDNWLKTVAAVGSFIMADISFPRDLQQTIEDYLIPTAIRMLIWATFHERRLQLPASYMINFSNSSIFQSQGLIVDKRSAEQIVKDENLSKYERFKLACYFCLEDDIRNLYKQITLESEDIRNLYIQITLESDVHDFSQNVKLLVRYWLFCLEGGIERLKEIRDDFYIHGLFIAIDSCSKASVEYFWDKLSSEKRRFIVVTAALKTAKYSGNKKNPWFLRKYYIDILVFFFTRMEKIQQIKFFRKDLEVCGNCRILKYLLQWPYQDYFMNTANLIWEFLPLSNFGELLITIARMIDIKVTTLEVIHGEQNCYDYRTLLADFWCQSPHRHKRYTLRNNNEIVLGYNVTSNIAIKLLTQLFEIQHFNSKDKRNVELILASYSFEEKKNLLYSWNGSTICATLARREKWEILEHFILNCLLSEENIKEYKKKFFLSQLGLQIIWLFENKNRYDAVEVFCKWNYKSENELDEETILHKSVQSCLLHFALYQGKVDVVERIIRRYVSLEESVCDVKKTLIFSKQGKRKFYETLTRNKFNYIEYIEKCLQWCAITSKQEIIDFKQKFAYEMGYLVCQTLIFSDSWLQLESFLTFCFCTEEDISDFKKKFYLEVLSGAFHADLLIKNKWEIAERFFDWLDLNASEIKELKLKTLQDIRIKMLFRYLIFDDEHFRILGEFSDKEEGIEHFFKWLLMDEETALEFQKDFKLANKNRRSEIVLTKFDMRIQKHLIYLEEQEDFKKGIRRKYEPSDEEENQSKILKRFHDKIQK